MNIQKCSLLDPSQILIIQNYFDSYKDVAARDSYCLTQVSDPGPSKPSHLCKKEKY